jgi:TRAP-type mannitol/chloroaromatic compound transport system permease small subunit
MDQRLVRGVVTNPPVAGVVCGENVAMKPIQTLSKGIERFVDWSGERFKWLGLVFVLTITYDVVMRYVLNMPTKWSYETSYMVGGSMMVLGGGYVMLHDGHVRIDVLYNRLSIGKQVILDLALSLLFFFPMVGILTKISYDMALQSWVRHELSNQSYWHPPLAPFRTIVFLGFCLVSLEGVAWFVRKLGQLSRILRGEKLD